MSGAIYVTVRFRTLKPGEMVIKEGIHADHLVGRYRREGWWRDLLIWRAKRYFRSHWSAPRIEQVLDTRFRYAIEDRMT